MRWYPGVVERNHFDGTCDVFFDDGDRQARVELARIRKIDTKKAALGAHYGWLSEGDKVEANYRGKGNWYPGKIARDRGDDMYDIYYDEDGVTELRVDKSLIRYLDEYIYNHVGDGEHLREGDKVEARYREHSKFYQGKISRDRGDGTCV